MNEPLLFHAGGDRAELAAELETSWQQHRTTAIAAPEEIQQLAQALPQRCDPAWGPAVVLGTGGSTGGRRWCLQPLEHLQVAVAGAAQWLERLGFSPSRLELFNPLPLQHVSGLMPLLRARAWGADLRWLPPELMRTPNALLAQALPRDPQRAVLSLVPMQLERLLETTAGIRWIEHFALIWVGGAALPASLALRARQLGLPLSPCYGSTETGAMVAALAPERFLAGVEGCGLPLPHAQLQLEPDGAALEIKAASLALGCFQAGELEPLPTCRGWWRSGDRAQLLVEGLQLLGRLDGAIQSGAETVFPEQVEQRLLEMAKSAAIPVLELLLLPDPDPLWGERLLALVHVENNSVAALERLQALARTLPPSQRPRRWVMCPELVRSPLGKWERGDWLRRVQKMAALDDERS